MPINTKLKSLISRREAFKREVQLLSGGFTNPGAFPDGKITVYPWDAEVDTILTSERNPQENIYAVFSRVVDLKDTPVENFVFGEVNALLLLSRAIQFGGNVGYKARCPYCQNVTDESIIIPDELEPRGAKQPGYPGYDEIILPNSGDVVHIRPLTVGDHNLIEQRPKEEKELLPDSIMFILVPVVSVGGGKPETRAELLTWFRALHPEDARFLEEREDLLTPHLNNRIPHTCDRCRREFKQILMFDHEFFVREAEESQALRWRKVFNLAWEGKGFTVDLVSLPDGVLDQFLEWREERIKDEEEYYKSKLAQ